MITTFLHSRGAAIAAAVIATACIVLAVPLLAGESGIVGVVQGTVVGTATCYVLANLGVAALMIFINRAFNVLRSLTSLVGAMFLIMQCGAPLGALLSWQGLLLLFVALADICLLFYSFDDFQPTSARRVFLAFWLSVCGSLVCYWFGYSFVVLFFPVVLFIGVMQMRIMSLRALMAAFMGAVTGILFFGVAVVLFPGWTGRLSEASLAPLNWRAVATLAFTIILGLSFTMVNLVKILSYNARVRAYNGFLTVLFFATAILSVFAVRSYYIFLPLLNAMVAYQIAHFFTYRRFKRSYIPILLIMAVYLTLFFLPLIFPRWEIPYA